MTRGFLMFAHNNEQIDYTLIALCNALMIKANLVENAVALVTNRGSYDWLIKHQGEEIVRKAFDKVIFQDRPSETQKRRYNDTASTSRELSWHNSTRASAYDLSPFDETVLLDADYLVMDRTLDAVWGNPEDVLMNRRALTLEHKAPHHEEVRLEPYGIPMYWATCVFFRKSERAEALFKMVAHVRDNYDYYQSLYRFPGRLFRNDYAFSIAVHTLNGWFDGGADALPSPVLLTSFDHDELIAAPARNELTFLVHDATTRGFRASRIKGVNVHVMNKFSITRHASRLIELYGGQR